MYIQCKHKYKSVESRQEYGGGGGGGGDPGFYIGERGVKMEGLN